MSSLIDQNILHVKTKDGKYRFKAQEVAWHNNITINTVYESRSNAKANRRDMYDKIMILDLAISDQWTALTYGRDFV